MMQATAAPVAVATASSQVHGAVTDCPTLDSFPYLHHFTHPLMAQNGLVEPGTKEPFLATGFFPSGVINELKVCAADSATLHLQ